jgi:hypothetical protein
MKTIQILFLLFCLPGRSYAQNIFVANNASVSFFSSTVVEDIEATSTTASSVLDTKSRNIIFRVSNTSLSFKKKMMQDHFNENYMESDKYPYSEFKGTITDDVDLSKDGNYVVNVSGNLNVHGVTKSYQTKATLSVKQGIITAKATFRVRIEDHKIKIPSLVFKNIAEFVDVRVSGVYRPKNP